MKWVVFQHREGRLFCNGEVICDVGLDPIDRSDRFGLKAQFLQPGAAAFWDKPLPCNLRICKPGGLRSGSPAELRSPGNFHRSIGGSVFSERYVRLFDGAQFRHAGGKTPAYALRGGVTVGIFMPYDISAEQWGEYYRVRFATDEEVYGALDETAVPA